MNKLSKKNNRILLIIILLVLFLSVSYLTPLSSALKEGVFKVTSPFQEDALEGGSSFFGLVDVLRNSQEIKEEIKSLRLENRELLSDISKLESVKEENKALKKALDISTDKELDTVVSEVFSRSIAKQFIIVSHEESNVEEKDTAITPEGVLLGSVVETYGRFSKIELITSKDSSFEVKVQNEDGPIGVLTGNTDNLFLDMLPQDKKISVGDRVTTLPVEETKARGIFIGEVSEVVGDDKDPFTRAYLKQSFDPQYLDRVFIISEKNE